jgi:hypothetical protein
MVCMKKESSSAPKGVVGKGTPGEDRKQREGAYLAK